VGLLLALGIVIPDAPKVKAAAELPTVEVGLPEDGVFGLGGYYILDNKLDRKNGFVMKPRWSAVAEVQRLMGIGAISLGLAVSEVALRANLKGTLIRLVQPYQVSHNFVLVAKDSPYQDIMELKGKAVAITSETTALYNLFDFLMRKRGVNIESDFKLKKLAAAAMIAVLEKGDVQAAVLWEAHVSRMLATGRYRSIMGLREETTKLFDGKIVFLSYLGVLEPWVKQNSQLVPKLRAAWSEASKAVQDDEAHFRKHAKRLFGLETPAEIDLGWKRTRTILAPKDLKWPDPTLIAVQKRYLNEATDLGIFPPEAKKHIEALFVP
jgi:ABC-type nitrate/sulfonate/bicarbonate transport system substrate-binding protein